MPGPAVIAAVLAGSTPRAFRPRMIRCLAVAALLSVCSCSFGMKTASTNWDGSTKPNCDDGHGAAEIDLAMSGTLAGGALAAIGNNAAEVGAVALLAAAAYGVSAAYGYKKAEACHGQTEEYYANAAADRGAREEHERERVRERDDDRNALRAPCRDELRVRTAWFLLLCASLLSLQRRMRSRARARRRGRVRPPALNQSAKNIRGAGSSAPTA